MAARRQPDKYMDVIHDSMVKYAVKEKGAAKVSCTVSSEALYCLTSSHIQERTLKS